MMANPIPNANQVVSDEQAEVLSQGGPVPEEEPPLEGEGGGRAAAPAAVEWLCVTIRPAPRAL